MVGVKPECMELLELLRIKDQELEAIRKRGTEEAIKQVEEERRRLTEEFDKCNAGGE